MALLGSTTTVAAQAGRKLNNSLTLEFKTSPTDTLATAVQKGTVGTLLGFRNGGAATYAVTGTGGELAVRCATERTTVADGSGASLGWIEKDHVGDGVVSRADGTALARVVGHPAGDRKDATWPYGLLDGSGAPLGTLTWMRTAATFDLAGEVFDAAIWWDRAGAPLKVPSLGAHLALDHPVDAVTGDLLLALCVDVSLGSHSFLRA